MVGALTELLGYFYQVGHFTQLEAVARTILTTIPDDTVSLHFLGLAYLRTGRAGAAARLFHKKARETPERKPTAMATSQDAQTAADACYRATTELNPGFADTWYGMAMELDELGLQEQAVSVLHNAVIARPGFPEALSALARIGLQSGDSSAAYRGLCGLLENDPGNIEAQRSLQQLNRQRPELIAMPDSLETRTNETRRLMFDDAQGS